MERLKKERNQLENTASKLLSHALKAGAESAEVCGTYGVKTKITLEKQDFHLASSDDGYQLGIRVLLDGRQGFASCNSVDPQELKDVAAKAVEIARFSPQNPYNVILATENVAKEAPSDLWDDALFDLSLQTQKDWTKLMADEATREPRFRLNDGALSISAGLYLVVNSAGTHKLEKETDLVWSVMGMAVDGDNITSFDYFTELSRKAARVPDRIVATTKKFRDVLVANLKSGAASSYNGLVAFTPRAAMEVLVSPLEYHINGRNVVEGTSKWKLDTIGQPILNPAISLVDKPWLTDRFGCTVFDREGTPTRHQAAIEKGVLKQFFFDQYAGTALNRPSTGHAVGGPSGVASVSSHCLCAEAGEEPLNSLYRRTFQTQKDMLLVHRFSGQVDPVSGDFSGVAKGGEWWHAGERAYFVKETLISGNIFDALGKNLFGMSKETEIVDGQGDCPTFIINNVSVTSGNKNT
jgi:PmbA protein